MLHLRQPGKNELKHRLNHMFCTLRTSAAEPLLYGGSHVNPGNPRNIEASIRQKPLNVATRNREDFGLILTPYALERLLYRLSQSRDHDHFVLKGVPMGLRPSKVDENRFQ